MSGTILETPTEGRARTRRLHPVPIRIMHWLNALAMIVMISSGWGIYNDEVIFVVAVFPGCAGDRVLGGGAFAMAFRGDVAAGGERGGLPGVLGW